MKEKERIGHIIAALEKQYPQDLCSLQYRIPHELLIAVRLAAQCTDARVNMVVPALFARYPDINAFAKADVADVEEMVRSCGFYHTKARDIVEMCKMLRDEYGGKVPDSIEELTRLPGVGRKTANLICGDIYGQPSYVCDTHCIRITNLLGLTTGKDPYKVEMQLRKIHRVLSSYGAAGTGILHCKTPAVRRMSPCCLLPLRPKK